MYRSQTTVQKGDTFQLVSCHDEYSLWFDVTKTPPSSNEPISLPSPEPGLHLAMSRTRLGQVNSEARNKTYSRAIRKLLSRYSSFILTCS